MVLMFCIVEAVTVPKNRYRALKKNRTLRIDKINERSLPAKSIDSCTSVSDASHSQTREDKRIDVDKESCRLEYA